MRRRVALTVLLAGLSSTALAQTPPGGDAAAAGPGPGGSGRGRHAMAERFAAADTNGDGHLTLAEAQAARWHRVVDHFSVIDTDHDGTITLAELRAWRNANRAAPPGSPPLPPPPGQH